VIVRQGMAVIASAFRPDTSRWYEPSHIPPSWESPVSDAPRTSLDAYRLDVDRPPRRPAVPGNLRHSDLTSTMSRDGELVALQVTCKSLKVFAGGVEYVGSRTGPFFEHCDSDCFNWARRSRHQVGDSQSTIVAVASAFGLHPTGAYASLHLSEHNCRDFCKS